MTSAQRGQHRAAAAGAEIPGHRAGGVDHRLGQALPAGWLQQPLGRPHDADRPGDAALPVHDRRGHSCVADRGLLVLDGVALLADLGQRAAERRPWSSSSGRSAGPGLRPSRGRSPPPAGWRRSRGRARRRATVWPPPPRGSAPCCRAGTRDAARSPGNRTAWRPRPPRSPAVPGTRPTAATGRAARTRPGRHCPAGGRRGPGCTCRCPDPGRRGHASPASAATRRRSAWPARPARQSRSRQAAAFPSPVRRESRPRAPQTGSCSPFGNVEHYSG